ncbi:NAD(P)-binding protein [Campylobacter jejuni]|nr:NAD(P)-binding protein [Campylobacter jejuni]
MKNYIILGAGIAGISVAYHLKQKNISSIIYEKNHYYGGLCSSFKINDFIFDNAVHLSFTKDEYVKKLFSNSCRVISHKPPKISNYYKGYWLKHPAQNNLEPLELKEKIDIISDFCENPYKNIEINNYEDWLKAQYGKYFSQNFTMRYTRKYWNIEAKDLSTSWVGSRMYKPNISEVLKGAFEKETPNTYYADEMRVPQYGGYQSFLNLMAKECNIQYDKEIIEINPANKMIYFKDGSFKNYDVLVSTLPLPEYAKLIKNIPNEISLACQKLKYTSVVLVSLGFSKPDIAKHIWFYIYDEDILPARCYSPNKKSPYNVPKNCSSLQFEIYFSQDKPLNFDENEIIKKVVNQGKKMGIFCEEDIILKDYRILPYGNVIFYHNMEKDREKIRNFLESCNIHTAGRFGKWEYLWSDQSLLSGKEVAEKLYEL